MSDTTNYPANGFIVTLAADGVIDVSPLMADYNHHRAREQLRHELRATMDRMLSPPRDDE